MKEVIQVAIAVLGYLALVAILVIISAFIITLVWGWVVPDVFSGMVEAKLLPATLTIWQAIKLAVLFWALGLTQSRGASK